MSAASTDPRSHALEFWACLLRGHAAVRRSLTAQLEAAHGLTVTDYEALWLLARAEGNCMRRVDLAAGLQLTASGVTRLLDGLERQGLVRKKACATDARVTYAVLTKPGRTKLERASTAHVSAIEAVFERCYSPGELAVLAELMARLPGAAAATKRQIAA
jgi:MarR family transcriptional regulator, 2-MHQ and catechol-resistance regulon repressor